MSLPHVSMTAPIALAADGCDRATAYHMSNKILRREDGIYVTWLDVGYRIMVGRVTAAGELEFAYPLAQGIDNHCGAALAATPDGRMHVVVGSHGHGFIHLFTESPAQPGSWSLPASIGIGATYPSLLSLAGGELALAYRFTGSDPQGVHFIRRPAGGPQWGWPLTLLQMPAPGYVFTTNSLASSPGGTLHLLAEFHKTYPQNRAPAHTMAICHLESPDGGVTWFHDDGRPVARVPVCLEDTSPVIFRGGGNPRIGNLVVLADGRPAFCCWDQFACTLDLHVRMPDRKWLRHGLTDAASALRPGARPGFHAALAPHADGTLTAICTLSENGCWADPTQTLAGLRIDPRDGSILAAAAVSDDLPGTPSWLPSIEKNRIFEAGDAPFLLYTRGINGPTHNSCAPCEVMLKRVEVAPKG
jgi:hypothetical protein